VITTRTFHGVAQLLAVLVFSLALAACGGGGGSNPTPPASGSQIPASGPVLPASDPAQPASGPASGPVTPASGPQGPGNTVSITSFIQPAMSGIDYIVNTVADAMSGDVVITLPANPAANDVIRVKSGTASNLAKWRIAQNAGQWIKTETVLGNRLVGEVLNPYQAPSGTAANQNWWFVASSANGEKLAAVGNSFQPLHPVGATAIGTVWISADAGLTWTERTQPGNRPWVSIASSPDGTKLAAVAIGTGIWTSKDSGQTWTEDSLIGIVDSAATEFVSIAMSADGTRMVAATVDTPEPFDNTLPSNGQIPGNGRIYTYVQVGPDFGSGKWTLQNGADTTHQWRGVAMSANGTTVIAAAYRDDGNLAEGVYISQDSGVTWTLSFAPPNDPTVGRSAYRVAISADGTRMIMAERFGRVYISNNSVSSWTAVSGYGGGFNAVASSADGLTLSAVQATGFAPGSEGNNPPPGRDGKLLVTTNGGANWIDRAAGAPRWWRGTAISGDGNRLLAAVDGGPIYVSTGNRTTLGLNGSLTGMQGDELQLKYLGGGIFEATSNAGPAYTIR
jgi:hypothetical protein